MAKKIIILDNIHMLPSTQEQLSSLLDQDLEFPAEHTETPNELAIRAKGADGVLVSPFTKLSKEFFNSCTNLNYVGVCGSSIENIDLEAAEEHGVKVTNVTGYGDIPVAEVVFSKLVSLSRGFEEYKWKEDPVELFGKSIGIIGLGDLGKSIANFALSYGMKSSYFSHTRKPEWEEKGLAYKELTELLQSCEMIVLATPTNELILSKTEFDAIKNGSILVKLSSGSSFESKDFLEWIARPNNFAMFDMASGQENYEKYAHLNRVIFPKVIFGHSIETKQRLGLDVIKNLCDFLGLSA